MLPVTPPGYGNSPYSAESAFAGSTALISPDLLVEEGLLEPRDVETLHSFPAERVDHATVLPYRERLLRKAFAAFSDGKGDDSGYTSFCEQSRGWLDDYALYCALKRAHRFSAWTAWEPELRDREPRALEEAKARYREEIEFVRFGQFIFERQFRALRAVAAAKGIGLIGDAPIFVAHDSADVWQNRELFRLDKKGRLTAVAGVPPDYFSATGQRWGNPLYHWKRMRQGRYKWWIERFKTTLSRFDVVRLDHFIGFQRYWRIPASCPTAVEGRWMKGPGSHFFRAVHRALGTLPFIAEDLGAMTPKVRALRDEFGLPGTRVLQFAFGTDPQAHSFLPHNYRRRTVVYTGTHDNDTTRGWFYDEGGADNARSKEQTEKERRAAMEYLGSDGREIHWDMIRAALMSVAATAIVPVQDLLGLGSEARMNRPGIASGSWEFRLAPGALTESIALRLGRMTAIYGRSGEGEGHP